MGSGGYHIQSPHARSLGEASTEMDSYGGRLALQKPGLKLYFVARAKRREQQLTYQAVRLGILEGVFGQV
jgi:hypothetical protein